MAAYNLTHGICSKVRPLLNASLDARYILARSYHEKVIDHYENPRNVGSFDKTEDNVGTGLVGAPACGDVMKLQVRLISNDNKQNEMKFVDFDDYKLIKFYFNRKLQV